MLQLHLIKKLPFINSWPYESLVKYVVEICAASDDDYDSVSDEDRIGSAQCTQTVNSMYLLESLV